MEALHLSIEKRPLINKKGNDKAAGGAHQVIISSVLIEFHMKMKAIGPEMYPLPI